MSDPKALSGLELPLDRTADVPIGEQIYTSLKRAIMEGRLRPAARLPSARDLAAQLGVARGTVRAAYDRLADETLVFSAGAAGTRVARVLPPRAAAADTASLNDAFSSFTHPYAGHPLPFQMGVPAHDAFPAKVWARMRTRALRAEAYGHALYSDPRGDPALRAQLAAHLAVSRQIQCHPDQLFITSGYRHGLLLALMALDCQGRAAWVEDPGYPLGRQALKLAGLQAVPVGVDEEGLRVSDGVVHAAHAALALVSPSQQAPTGVALSRQRRTELLDWAAAQNSWIIEDDYLGELQIDGRAAPALASGDANGRVVHIGSFNKTIGPTLGLGFVICPPPIVHRLSEAATVLAPAPNRTTQLALGQFLADGHYLRHLRHMKTIYAERRSAALRQLGYLDLELSTAGLTIIAHLQGDADDQALAAQAPVRGIAPSPLSLWFADPARARQGLIMSVTNLRADTAAVAVDALAALIDAK